MNCKEVERQEILEGYLLDRLTNSQREEFEQHYFGCASCFSRLQSLRMVQEELWRQPVTEARVGLARRIWVWTPAFVTLASLLVVGSWWYVARKQQRGQQVSSLPQQAHTEVLVQVEPPTPLSLDELARVEPPPYSAVVLRGAEDEAHETFRKAMGHYVKGDYADSIPGLRAAVKASPRTPSFSFYLGACYLLTNQTDLAIESFRRILSLGDPTYSEPTHFYLAKAYLRKKDLSAAGNELQTTIGLHGRKEAEAGEILRQLHK